MSLHLLARAEGLRAQRSPFVLATVVRAERPSSARPGDRAIVFGDGQIEGFAGGACATATLQAQSAQLLQTGGTALLRITPASGAPEPPPAAGTVVVDNPCLSGGSLEILLEAVRPPTLVYVFGEGPLAQALVAVGDAAGFEVSAAADPAAALPADTAAVVVASYGHHELPVLRAALAGNVPYVALVASPKRGAAVLAELGLPAAEVDRVKTPAGLDLGARTPGEIAVSIIAELISRRVSSATSAAPAAPVTATDPVCGMSVAAVPASLQYEYGGQVWFFCAPGCRRAFIDDPARFGA